VYRGSSHEIPLTVRAESYGNALAGHQLTLPGVEEGDATTFANHEEEEKGGGRETLKAWAAKKIKRREMMDFQKLNNAYSIDRLLGLKSARASQNQNVAVRDTKA
jgi:hypothetical protein